MRAIEYNTFMTILKLLGDRLPDIANSYGISNISIPVLPAYPADLTDMEKPSIIVRKVDTRQSKVGLGNVLGQFYDSELGGYSDVVGKRHDIMMQFDVVTSNNMHRSLFESIISDDILNYISYSESGNIILYDFTRDMNNPEPIGILKLIGDSNIINIMDKDSTNTNYIGVVRHNFATIQTIVPQQDYVDLSKWIKMTYKIKL